MSQYTVRYFPVPDAPGLMFEADYDTPEAAKAAAEKLKAKGYKAEIREWGGGMNIGGWMVIPDDRIRLVWGCPVCKKEACVPPTFFEESGEPMCFNECREEPMEYIRTEVIAEEGQK